MPKLKFYPTVIAALAGLVVGLILVDSNREESEPLQTPSPMVSPTVSTATPTP